MITGTQKDIKSDGLVSQIIKRLTNLEKFKNNNLTTNSTNGYGEGHISILPMNYSSIVQGAWSFVITGSQFINGIYFNTSNAQNDAVEYKAFLSIGTYQLDFFGMTNNAYAINSVYLDGVLIGALDLYTPAIAYNVKNSITGIVVATPGIKTIRFKAASRNGASGGWYLVFSQFSLFRTA